MSEVGMSWSDNLMASLDARATVLRTARGDVQLARDGAGPPVLAIHGGPGGFDQGLAWCRHLRDGGCEVIAPSRPGYLRTPLASGRQAESQADLYAAMLDALRIQEVAVLAFSSGGPSAVHFAARYPDRTAALFLDNAILQPFEPPISRWQRTTIESPAIVWLAYQLATRRPALIARVATGGASHGLSRAEKKAAVRWITSDPGQLRSVQDQLASIAPTKHRAAGWANDQANERVLAPLPFADIAAPALIAYGANDAIVPADHAVNAAQQVTGAELVLVEQGHHLLSVSPRYGPVARRQLELAHG